MEQPGRTRWEEKHEAIVDAAARLFLRHGYPGTSMDDVAAEAAVSKQTVYKHFSDKEQLFTHVVLATTDQVDAMVRLVAAGVGGTTDVEGELGHLARSFLGTLMAPPLLRLRRLVISSAGQFPAVGRTWYERGFERVLEALAERFRHLAEAGLLEVADPLLAAHHFTGLLLWIPVNRAMFTGDESAMAEADVDRYATGAVGAFLRGYGAAALPPR
jgi:TetR/AcrR family transcriptional repressor of mexJK operon